MNCPEGHHWVWEFSLFYLQSRTLQRQRDIEEEDELEEEENDQDEVEKSEEEEEEMYESLLEEGQRTRQSYAAQYSEMRMWQK